ncbi:MAG: hypothetical protein A3I89_03250 [Candidatus Harrisonbacteria bacterium RIFCSPLOWO2_02_FULL_41_11]|uniref:Uncharacterized protein n=1 Tax=Candidatus Harrisonbacteria bacterium RIFCSPHIGHO2_02_FULL_42_16 TaxID=1798404 RepID=A0A1G1ZIK2_9BACT|nr:MAG: hypothetical protein A3B92_02740 [Candidatus Harrisonbacteria bacterium RIFCSPHIGHO2_02_FULL_42_16]OGY66255.1 MAG: hypothetical protein A3I89_03250 [Candidatus Harrisonbacteria bacterium RIFCSPLOWO2_02_FULL_41_11]
MILKRNSKNYIPIIKNFTKNSGRKNLSKLFTKKGVLDMMIKMAQKILSFGAETAILPIQ